MKKIPKDLSKFSKKELDSFFQSAKRAYRSQAFTILVDSTPHEFGKLLCIVSRKYGNAPERNLVKRRLKSIFREEKLYEKQKNIVVIARSEAKRLSFQEIKKIILDAIK